MMNLMQVRNFSYLTYVLEELENKTLVKFYEPY